jgi:hypothetical protein
VGAPLRIPRAASIIDGEHTAVVYR